MPEAVATPGGPSMMMQLVPFLFIFFIFYFLIIRPQNKKLKAQNDFVSNLKHGDEVVTSSGIIGRIDGMTDLIVTLEVSSGAKMKILRRQITGSLAQLTQPQTAEKKG